MNVKHLSGQATTQAGTSARRSICVRTACAKPALRAAGQHGFTLIEAIIAAGLLGFLALTATFFWVKGLGLARTVNADSAAIADGRATLERLAREVREMKFGASSNAFCVGTMTATKLAYNKNVGTAAPACSGVATPPTNANNDIAVTVELPANSSSLNLTYAGTLAAPAATRALTTFASAFNIAYLDSNYTATTSAAALRYVELTLTVRASNGQATQTRTVVALRNK